RRWNDVIVEPVLVTVSDRRFLGREVHAYLRAGIAGAVPASKWVGAQRSLTFKLDQPATGNGVARLRGLAVELGNSRGRHNPALGKADPANQVLAGSSCWRRNRSVSAGDRELDGFDQRRLGLA